MQDARQTVSIKAGIQTMCSSPVTEGSVIDELGGAPLVSRRFLEVPSLDALSIGSLKTSR